MTDAVATADDVPTTQWRLAEVQLANWGTFDAAIHRIPVARRGHLITGPSGSGKSSLLDAIAAVLTPDKWLRLNEAAQGAGSREDRRSLFSYVRGAWSRTVDDSEDRVVSAYLRGRATWSGIVLRYDDGVGSSISLCRLFFLTATGTSTADLRDLCLLQRSAVDLRDLEPFAAGGLATRRVKQAWPEAVVTSNQSHGAFYSRLRTIFGIADETALQLLHKTQSAKSLDSLDRLFRDFMLEEPETFALARTAVEQFGELRDAHDRVVLLRQQRDHLLDLRESARGYESAEAQARTSQTLVEAVQPYSRRRTLTLAERELDELRERLQRLEIAATYADDAYAAADASYERAARRALELGGAEADHLQQQVRAAGEAHEEVRDRWRRFDEQVRQVGIDGAPQDAEAFAELMRAIDEIIGGDSGPSGPDHALLTQRARARDDVDEIDRAIESLRLSRSTVPEQLVAVRGHLAEYLRVPPAALPFAAELLEVSAEHRAWTGAIERVLRPFALTLLVRSPQLPAVRHWIDGRRIGARFVFEEVTDDQTAPRPVSGDRSLVHRVNVSAGPFEHWVGAQLSQRYDLACVDSPDELDEHVKAVTINGQIKTSRTRYEKDDRVDIGDRSHWVLGDRESKLEALVERKALADQRFAELEAEVRRLVKARRQADEQRGALRTLRNQSWHDIDQATAARRVKQLTDQLAELTRADSDLSSAVEAQTRARDERTIAEQARSDAAVELRTARDAEHEIDSAIAALEAELDSGRIAEVPDDVVTELDARFRAVQRHLDRRVIGDVAQAVTQRLADERARALDRATKAGQAVVASASTFNERFPAAATAADLVPRVEDRAAYLELLDAILAQGLPEHEATFLRLLRDRSRDMIGELVNEVYNAPRAIDDRVRPVNQSLLRSAFDHERFLRLRVKTRRSETVNRFIADLRSIADNSWTDDDLKSAEQRFETLAEIMRGFASSEHADRAWRQACLDTRQHVTFLAEEIDASGRVHATYDSGAAMSGGQQQKLVIFCLAAALRYQLADPDDSYSRYGTIILDEAFDKADTRYTRMALDIFVEFGFQMVLATPQKLLQTIEPYVGAATSIENPSRRRSEISQVTWTEQRR